MRRLSILVISVLAASCTPTQEPIGEGFEGWWRPVAESGGCEAVALRLERNAITVRARGGDLPGVKVIEVKGNGAKVDLTMAPSLFSAASLTTLGSGKRVDPFDLGGRELLITLHRSGDRISASNIMVRKNKSEEVRSASANVENLLRDLFTMKRCPV